MRARELMSTPVVTVYPETPLKNVAETMAAHQVSGVPVVDHHGRLLGIVSESDFLARMEIPRRPGFLGRLLQSAAARSRLSGRTASDLMTTPVITAGPQARVRDLVHLMTAHDINRLPIVDEGRVVGLVTRADILRVLARPDEAITEEVLWRLVREFWIDTDAVEVTTRGGVVTIAGSLDTRTDADLVARFAASVDGVVAVETAGLHYRIDDRHVKVP